MTAYRASRCGVCYWALYDGHWCQNPACEVKVAENIVRLTNKEAEILIKWKGAVRLILL